MSCQKKIVSEHADYVIALQSNQRSSYNFAKKCFSSKFPCFETQEHKHGRDEIRTYYLNTEIDEFPQIGQWSGLKAIGKAVTKMVKGDKPESAKLKIEKPLKNGFIVTKNRLKTLLIFFTYWMKKKSIPKEAILLITKTFVQIKSI